jgi:choline kinase
MMSPTLLVLAAGMGSRYGGLKQIDPVGPTGETVLDYAVFDAVRAGFKRVVFVIREEFAEIFKTQVAAKYADKIAVGYVYQSLTALPAGFAVPAGREKPWGTGHAVWCAREVLGEKFAVINADDFYGADSFAQLSGFLAAPIAAGYDPMSGHRPPKAAIAAFAMVGFRLDRTLSEHGVVSRGVCTVNYGQLRGIVEQTGILAAEVGAGKKFSGEETVSMNCWGFTSAVLAGLAAQFEEFLTTRGSDPKAEFYLPAAVAGMVGRGEATVRVLPTASTWFGVTYREDKPRVQAAILELVGSGAYPTKLF